jgi:5'(3')-deoxyribonucleotidase
MYTIYCDIDGVLADFEKGYAELTNTKPSKSFNGKQEFWKPISDAGASFWANLDWMSDGQTLWNYIKKYKPYILSAPSMEQSSRIGKDDWVKTHMPGEYRKLLLYPRAQKVLFANEDKILIDDMEQTIREWKNAGGIGILHTSAANTIKELKKLGL